MTLTGSYEQLSAEYYDDRLHPTSANFREASRIVLEHWIPSLGLGDEWICEVGAGRSLLCEVLEGEQKSLDKVLLTDRSYSMLVSSCKWRDRGAHLAVCEAGALPLPSSSIGTWVSILGDSFDTESLWAETARIVRPGGVAIHTTPSYEWAAAFRRGKGFSVAEFRTTDGNQVAVPSFVRPIEQERALIESAGLSVKEVNAVPMSALRSLALSPKLTSVLTESDTALVGYLIVRS